MAPTRPTLEERLRHCEGVFALMADLGALAVMSDERSVSAESFYTVARLAEDAGGHVREIQRTLSAKTLNLTAGRTRGTAA
jgi:hypothetical protein